MSTFASILRMAYKLSGAKKAFGLPEDEITKVIEKQNRHRGAQQCAGKTAAAAEAHRCRISRRSAVE